jgi:hypothetical protein
MSTDSTTIVSYLRNLAANTFCNDDGSIITIDRHEHRCKMILKAAEKIESLQSFLGWREQLLRDATRYFDIGDDDAVAYYKALDRQDLTFNYSEKVNPRHKKEPKIDELLIDQAVDSGAKS